MPKIISNLVRVLFFIYVIIVAGAFVVFNIDNPMKHSGGMYQGFAGVIATVVASFPWSLIFIGLRFPNGFNETLLYVTLWLFAVLNLWLFYWLAYGQRQNIELGTQADRINYKAILRDAAVIWIAITLIDSVLQLFLTISSSGYQAFQAIQRLNMIVTTILFCVSHALATQGKFRHIVLVAVCVSVFNLVRIMMLSHSYYAEGFLSLLWMQRYVYMEMMLGGLISHLFIARRISKMSA